MNLMRLTLWRRTRNFVAIGNLGEQVTARLLLAKGYGLLACQDDLVGMVPDVLGKPTRDNPEDFIAEDPLGRLVTINSKASISSRACRITRNANLSRPRLARSQNTVEYSTERAQLISPFDGESFSQAVKVDLVHMLAQVFDIDGSAVLPLDRPVGIAAEVEAVMRLFPDRMPPPNVGDFV